MQKYNRMAHTVQEYIKYPRQKKHLSYLVSTSLVVSIQIYTTSNLVYQLASLR